jgi:hypothetical protein
MVTVRHKNEYSYQHLFPNPEAFNLLHAVSLGSFAYFPSKTIILLLAHLFLSLLELLTLIMNIAKSILDPKRQVKVRHQRKSFIFQVLLEHQRVYYGQRCFLLDFGAGIVLQRCLSL